MRSPLWFLLILSSTAVSSDESTREVSDSSAETRLPIFALADDIYDKQRECESIIGEAVVKVLDEGVYPIFPTPDDRYFQCKKNLDEKKREYIKTGLLGLDYYSTVFPMRLSNGRVVSLQVPDEEQPLEEADQAEFDVQEELCGTNKVCLSIIDKKFSNYDTEKDSKKQTGRLSRCTALLNDLKLKYIHTKKLDENELKKEGGLSVLCAERAIMFRLPNQINDLDYYTTSHSMGSVASKITSGTENGEDSKYSAKESSNYHNPYSEVIEESKSLVEKGRKVEHIPEDPSSEKNNIFPKPGDVKNPTKGEIESNDKTTISETIPQEDYTGDSTPKTLNNDLTSKENEIPASGNVSEEDLLISDSSGDEVLPPKEINSPNGSNKNVPEMLSTKTDAPENNSLIGDNQTPDNNENEKTDTNAELMKTKKSKNKNSSKPTKPKDDEKVDLLTYRVSLVSKNGEGNVVKIHASGRIKKSESGKQAPASTIQQLLGGLGSKSVDVLSDRHTDLVHKTIKLVYPLQKGDEAKKAKQRRHADTLEDNIIIMENDCKELLKFGEQLLEHKMLSSLISLEDQYNQCINKLDDLKKMYIKKTHLDVMSHRNIFPMTMPSGVQKLVLLPTQFLKAGLVESLSPTQSKHADVFEAGELSHKNDASEKLSSQSRKPFDDPVFIPNEVFLESLKQGSASPDTSTLSKVASMLHMNGGHNEKKIAE